MRIKAVNERACLSHPCPFARNRRALAAGTNANGADQLHRLHTATCKDPPVGDANVRSMNLRGPIPARWSSTSCRQ